MMKIGILGGTFDPVHRVHLELAHRALAQCHLDKVLFIPAGVPVRKQATAQASAQHRLNMLRLACEGDPCFEVSSLEVDKPQVSYTIDTLRELRAQLGASCELYLILGEDAALDIGTWKDSSEIAQLAKVVYARRPGGGAREMVVPHGFEFFELQMPLQDVASNSIRSLLDEGKDVSGLVPPEVLAYIKEQGLYGQP